QYAGLKSLAIKRRLSRDGDNQFFINGEKCRRRDVTDLFSGTGLGPRAYAIIEQGTIARLIDAKPDELRSFIEEAAGLSKYKDRRRETALRMEHSQDNLARLNDIAQEVQQQIARLSAQAQAAEQFRTLKARIRSAQTQLKALQWQELQAALAATAEASQTLAQQQAALAADGSANQQQQEALQAAQSQCLAAQDGAHEQVLALNQAIAQHLTATAHQQAQLQLWRQQEQEISQEISQLAGLLGEAKAQQEARAHQQHTLAQTQADQAQALARLRDHKRLVAEQLERQQQALVALEGDLQAQKAQRLLVLNQQALMAGHIQQAAEQLAQRQATLDRFQQAPTAAPVDGRTPAAAHLAELEGQLQQLQARRAAIESEQTQVAQQLAYLAGRLGRQQESTERCDTAETSLVSDGPWLDTWAAAEAWLQPWISAQPWTDDWQAASRESNAPLFLIRPQADTLGIVQWLSSWQSAADRAVALAALKAQPEGVFYTPSGEVFARDWLYLPATGESRFSLPERLAHLARLRERQAEL
ncbi:MAG TPA: hypothetical protein PK011_15955, partial [Marinagarivorans sp.]|nr:hypothetical protein [Marinagarivorans sp.]